MFLLLAAVAVSGAPETLLSQARAAERAGQPVEEYALCERLVRDHPRSPQASTCQARLLSLDALREAGALQGYQTLEQARRGQVSPEAVRPLVDSANPALAAQAQHWLEGESHQSAAYAAIDVRRRVLAWVSWGALLVLGALSWPLGRETWCARPRVLGVAIWAGLCVPALTLVQLYGGLSPRIWALLPAGAGVFLLSAGPAAQLHGLPRALWGLLSGAGALASSFLVLRWAEQLHWVGL